MKKSKKPKIESKLINNHAPSVEQRTFGRVKKHGLAKIGNVASEPLCDIELPLDVANWINGSKTFGTITSFSSFLMHKAPDFSLPDQDGQLVSLKSLLGQKWIVLFFYPKDDSLICSAQVCAFRDSYQEFLEAGAQLIGISADSVESHKHFHEKNNLPYKLLSDVDGKVRKAYAVPSTFGLIPGRVTFVIDPQGMIRYQFNSQFNANKHITESLRMLEKIGRRTATDS